MPGNALPTRSTKLKTNGIKEVSMFDYLPWDRKTIKETITGKLGWQKPCDSTSTWRTDCKLITVVNYCFHKTYGCTKHCFGYSRMINDGQMERDEALREEEEMLTELREGKKMRQLLRNEIGLSEKDTATILAMDK